jgi:hypothetical protein
MCRSSHVPPKYFNMWQESGGGLLTMDGRRVDDAKGEQLISAKGERVSNSHYAQ